jgi:hypothetical protein
MQANNKRMLLRCRGHVGNLLKSMTTLSVKESPKVTKFLKENAKQGELARTPAITQDLKAMTRETGKQPLQAVRPKCQLYL